MKLRLPTYLRTVKAKLFGGFLAMALLIAGVGGYALVSIGNAGDVVEDTFDRPLMAVNFARSAAQTFTALELESLRPSDPDDPQTYFDWLGEKFIEDLAIARERSISDRAESYFDDIEKDFVTWRAKERALLGNDWREEKESALALQIEENLDIVVELQANESFRNREAAIETMARIRRFSGLAVATALLLTIGMTAWIAVTIIRPLKAAANAAAKISGGRFDVQIPSGGDDETGQLLRTLRSMQSNIRTRMESEQDLRTLAQHRLADSLENSLDAVLLTDASGTVIVANAQLSTLFTKIGGTDAIIGRPYPIFFSEDGRPADLEATADQIGNAFQLADGRWVRVNASDTREGGRLFIWSDITESKQQEERLRIARDAAEAGSRAKTLFLAAMSHELNTPLNAIVGLSDVLEMQYRSTGDVSQADMAKMISQSGTHMAQIVSDVLEISSDEDAVEAMDLDVVDLTKSLDLAVQSLIGKAAASDVKLLWAKPDRACAVRGDAGDLKTLAVKLIDNAIKFNTAGGTVKAALVALDDGAVRLNVIDNGIGISKEHFGSILQPFQQVDEGYSRSVDGTGLGLCVADRIARRHGAQLTIQSMVGKGSLFSVTFPSVSDTSNVDDASDDPSEDTSERQAA